MRVIYLLIIMGLSLNSYAQLTAMTEEELELTDGQAFIGLDQYSQDGLDFTRINMGMDIEIVMNADEVVFGEYDRAGENETADIRFNNYAMGYIDQYGEVRPFEMKDPFFEFAYDRSDGTDDFVGFRFGFGESRGMMSMNAVSLTGNISVEIGGDFTPLPDTILDFIVLDANGRSSLVTPEGEEDVIRATHIGIPNGEKFIIDDPLARFLGIDEIIVNDCVASALGTSSPMCFPLNTFESMLIGDSNGEAVEGLFQSFQTRPIAWGNSSMGETQVMTTTGAFFNVPNGAVNISPDEAAAGTPRLATEFIDRGIGRFEHPNYRNGSVQYPQ